MPVDNTREIIPQLKRVLRRRKLLLIVTPVLFLVLSYVALQFIEPKYNSMVSILVDNEEIFNPSVIYDMRGDNRPPSTAEQAQNFDNIVFSRTTMEMLIDSLGLEDSIQTITDRRRLVSNLRKKIGTELTVTDSYEITFTDTDPLMAKEGARLLGNHFLETRLRHQRRKNDETVEFFTAKINELETIVDQQREQVLSSTTERMKELPVESGAMQSRLTSIDTQIDELEWRIYQQENHIRVVEQFLNQSSENFNVQLLYRLPLEEIPYGGELSSLLSEFDELNQQFTESYPRLRTLRNQIREVSRRIPAALEGNISNTRQQVNELRNQRETVIENMERAFVATQRTNNSQSNIEVYQDLYNDLKLKLEQARMAQDISEQGSEKLMIIDEAVVAEEPSSPNPTLILGAGFFLGLILGGFCIGIAEALDNTIRSEEDLFFNKPIIAYLADERL